MLRQCCTTLTVATRGRELIEITAEVERWIAAQSMRDGVLTLFVRHTSASVLIQENADPVVRSDLERWFARLVTDGDSIFEHRDEGPDDMPAHVRAALLPTSLAVPLAAGRLVLGAWQGIYLYEHRTRAHRREVTLQLTGA
jgi:secondary thiamine-phosphate synthase enzyme